MTELDLNEGSSSSKSPIYILLDSIRSQDRVKAGCSPRTDDTL